MSFCDSSFERSVYTVPDEWVQRISDWAGFVPQIDCFASPKNKQFSRYWDKQLDAFRQDWSCLRLWINPPFSVLSKVVGKLASVSVSRAVVVVPKWQCASRWHDLDCITVNFWDPPKDFCCLKENGQVLPAPAWETRVCVVGGIFRRTTIFVCF